MQNFNTNQTRHFYVAGAIGSNGAVSNNLDIVIGGPTATGEMYFVYKNADGIVTRSDTFDPKKITSLKKTTAAQLNKPLMAHTIAIDTNAVALNSLVGKTLDLMITIHEFFDYDASNTITFTASVVGNATNTASAAAFHKDLAIAIAKALPKFDKQYPLIKVYSNGTEVTADTAAANVTGAAGGVVLVEGLQKYVRGKLSGEPCPFSVAFRLADGNMGDIAWGTDTVAKAASPVSPVAYPGTQALADLEYFALGERGDVYRGSMWPNEYTPTYAIDLSKSYNVLTIEYYWAGAAENVQKSPRMIQVAAEAKQSGDVVSSLFDTISAQTPAGINAAIDARLDALENE